MCYDDCDVSFRIDTHDGKKLDVHCLLAELGDVFSFLGMLANAASERRRNVSLAPSETYSYLALVPAQGIGFQAGSSSDETLLIMRLAGFDMALDRADLRRVRPPVAVTRERSGGHGAAPGPAVRLGVQL